MYFTLGYLPNLRLGKFLGTVTFVDGYFLCCCNTFPTGVFTFLAGQFCARVTKNGISNACIWICRECFPSKYISIC